MARLSEEEKEKLKEVHFGKCPKCGMDKGSITLDGVSLTVNEVRDDDGVTHFSVNIIPHTAEHTTFGQIALGQQFNVEIDVIARYLERMLANRAHATP